MHNGIENGYYHEITPSGFGIAIKAGKVLFSKQSDFQKVEVFETESALGRVLTLDDLMMTTEGDEYHYHEMITHIPMMHHKNPESVLVIGGGDGGTVREVLKHKTVKKVVLCEIDGMVIDACKEFLPTISCGLSDPRVEIKVEDAIEFIKDKKDEYDIILIDSTDPMGPGEGLFTEEFYTNVKNALKKGGIMASSHVGGLSGAFIPVSEDAGMIEATSKGYLTFDKLEAMTCVCSVGLDMIAIPGDTPKETIAGMIADEMAIGMINKKTTAVRVIPVVGKNIGDEIVYGGLLGKAPIIPVNKLSSAGFVCRGGRIPAPIHSLNN